MAKASTILIVSTTLVGTSLLLASAPGSRWLALAILAVTVGLFTWAIFDVNSSFWTRTVWRGPAGTRAVALTFDDGPDPSFTPRVLEILAAKQAPATFFVVGQRAARHPDLVKQIHERGHAVGNHSYTHALSFHFSHGRRLRREISACNETIRLAIGLEPVF